MSATKSIAPSIVGIVIPVHNEEELLERALDALEPAIESVRPSVAVRTVIVLDDCEDRSGVIARGWANRHHGCVISRSNANVGRTRHAGCLAIMHDFCQSSFSSVWLATTDADSEVPQNWLGAQLAAHQDGADVWSGRVTVVDWSERDGATRDRWLERYRQEHAPVHGANLGFTARSYSELGGFRALVTGEDRDLVQRADAAGLRVHYDHAASVVTSGRRRARAPRGFAFSLDMIGIPPDGRGITRPVLSAQSGSTGVRSCVSSGG